jgi:hypothetical protein
MTPRQFNEEASTHVMAITRTVVQSNKVIVNWEEVQRSPGSDNDLAAWTVTELWMETNATMIRRVAKREAAIEHVLTHLGENKNNNDTFTWSRPSGVLDCTLRRPEGQWRRWCSRDSFAKIQVTQDRWSLEPAELPGGENPSWGDN